MKYLFTGITGLRNRGVEALVVSSLEALQTVDASAEVRLFSGDAKYDQSVLSSAKAKVFAHPPDLFLKNRFPSIKWLKHRFGRSGRVESALRSEIAAADVVIATGGDMFASDYGIASLSRHIRPLEVAKKLGKKVAFIGHSIGPFKTEEELTLWKAIAEQSDLITLRERLSFDYVSHHLAASKVRIAHTADVAFLLKRAENPESITASVGLLPNIPIVGCSISGGITSFSGADHEQHIISWVECINHLVKRLSVQALLIPHVQETSVRNDDRRLVAEVIHRLSPDVASHVRQASGELRADEYKALISGCDMLIAERMHAGIAGLSTGVPTIVVGYSVKAKGILIDVLGSESEAEKFLISISDFCGSASWKEKISLRWASRTITRQILEQASSRLISAARENFTLLHQLTLSLR